MANRKQQFRELVKGLEALLNVKIPGTPRMPGRVLYVALPGSGRKSQNVLSHRAQQVLGVIRRQGRANSAALQAALKVNRNVIAGAIHELKQIKMVRAEPLLEGGGADERRPRRKRR